MPSVTDKDTTAAMSGRKRDKASTPARAKGTGARGPEDMDISDSEGIKKPPSILKKSTAAKGVQSPEKKKTKKNAKAQAEGKEGEETGGKPRGRAKSRDKSASGGSGMKSKPRSQSQARSVSKTPKARSTSKTPRARSTSKSASARSSSKDEKVTPDSFAKKAAPPPKTVIKKKPKKLDYSKFVGGVVEMPKSSMLRTDVYSKLMKLLTTCQSA